MRERERTSKERGRERERERERERSRQPILTWNVSGELTFHELLLSPCEQVVLGIKKQNMCVCEKIQWREEYETNCLLFHVCLGTNVYSRDREGLEK